MASVSTLGAAGSFAVDAGGALSTRGAAQKLSQLLSHGSRRSLDQTQERQPIVLLPRQAPNAAAQLGLLDTDFGRTARHGRLNPLQQLVTVSTGLNALRTGVVCFFRALSPPCSSPETTSRKNFPGSPSSVSTSATASRSHFKGASSHLPHLPHYVAALQVDLPAHSELPAALYRLQDVAAPVDLPPRHRTDVRSLDNRELDKLVGALGRNKARALACPAICAACGALFLCCGGGYKRLL